MRVLRNFSESLDIHSCDSKTFQRNVNCSRIVGTRILPQGWKEFKNHKVGSFQHKNLSSNMDLLQEENNQETGGKQCSSHHSIHEVKMMKRIQFITI